MVIGVTGYGGTGASAYMDLLKEFEDMQYYPRATEFQLIQQPDGITDLRYQLVESRRRLGISTAISRFIKRSSYDRSDVLSQYTNYKYKQLSMDYINSLIHVSWKGKSKFDPQDLLSSLESRRYRYFNAAMRRLLWKFNFSVDFPPNRYRYYSSVTEEQFVEKTKNYLNSIFVASGFDPGKPIALEQLFCLEHPTEGFEYFGGDSRSIIVDRDPRDYYTLVTLYWAKKTTAFMPNNGKVRDFVAYYKGLHHTKSSDDRVCYLQFEDLIYNYDDTVKKLERFTGLRQVRRFDFFRPNLSINNTKLYLKHPEIADDIAYIELELPEYLYPFGDQTGNLGFEPAQIDVFDVVPNDMDKVLKRNRRARN